MSAERADGFTLLELLATLAIVALLATLASPSFQETLLNARRTEVLNALIRSLHLARVESLRAGREAVVCPVDEDGLCAGRNDNWTGGWRVFVNRVGRDPSVLDAGDHVLLAREAPAIRRATVASMPTARPLSTGPSIAAPPTAR